ncbi:MAG: lipid A deacylase LpxR family protein, partial [Opitutales bacterium]|nr:lipid A deacylase LpxR family protein [Opitutales bacterium]
MSTLSSSELKKTFALGACFTLCAAGAHAGQSSAAGSVPAKSDPSRASLSLLDENDYWGKWSDKYYTNHTRIALTLEEDIHGITPFFSIGQEIYTPKEREAVIPDPKDHPYAGYIYFSFGSAWNDNNRTAFSQEIQIGATGEWSLAEQTQKEYHRMIDEIRPAGWDTQVHKRIVGQAIGDVRHRIMLCGECGNGAFAADAIVRGFGTLGNLRGIFSAG